MRLDWFRIFLVLIFIGIAIFGWSWFAGGVTDFAFLTPQSEEDVSLPEPTPLPLLGYEFPVLMEKNWDAGEIEIGELIEQEDEIEEVNRYKFYFNSEGRKVSGMMNVPEDLDIDDPDGVYPVILMLRGYVDKDIYETGIGTAHAAAFFAEHGYVTLALDYLGYGESDNQYEDVWEERFSRPVQVLNLLSSVGSLDFVDTDRIGMWAHSNGGQVALSVLEITGAEIPTTLWAPVTKPFPYAILYFTDEFDDEGLALRKDLARLEQDYDVRMFSITDFFDKIRAPLQLHQGTADDAVDVSWSREFVDKIKKDNKDIEIEYYEYSGADHNMNGGWDRAVARDLNFFSEYLEK